MMYEVVPTILSLFWMWTISPQYQELEYINQLNDFFCFDHNIFLLDSSVDLNCYIITPNSGTKQSKYTPQTLYIFQRTTGNIAGLDALATIQSKRTFVVVVSETSNFETGVGLRTEIKRIQRLDINMKIGIFFSHINSSDDIRKLFEWCWSNRIINVFAAFYVKDGKTQDYSSDPLLNVFRYNPFLTFNVINVSRSDSIGNIFPDKITNFQKHFLRMGIVNSLTVLDADKKLWSSVVRVMKASREVAHLNDSLLDPTQLGNYVDVLPHRLIIKEQRVHIYPLTMEYVVMLVPEALPYSDFIAYLRIVTSNDFFVYSLVTIAGVMALLTIFRYIKRKEILIFQSVVDVLNLLMNDNSKIKYPLLFRVEAFLIIPLTFAGFVIVNGILSNLQSYFTRPVIQPQINTIEDVVRSPFLILAPYGYWKEQLKLVLAKFEQRDWDDKLRSSITSEIVQQMSVFNTSIIFTTLYTYAKAVLDLQKKLNIRGYHIPPEIYMSKSMTHYYVNEDYPFIERINEIIHWLRNSGLYEKWKEEEKYFAVEKLWSYHGGHFGTQVEINSFPLPIFVPYGWVAGVVVLLIEIAWKSFQLANIFRKVLK